MSVRQILKDELENDPEKIGYAVLTKDGRDQDIADLLNTKDRPGRKLVDLWRVKLAAIENGYWINIKLAAATSQNETVRAVADTVISYVDDVRFSNIDMDRLSTLTMLGVLVAGGVMTQAQANDLSALANATLSRCEELFGPDSTVNAADIADALRGAD